ncbi:MAG TPA: ABC transporter permease [Baekduia sp.]|nr:ABC transporter permease [Baekduia sp.]
MASIASRLRASDEPRRLDRHSILGVLVREMINFTAYWKSTTFSSSVEPTIYLLAFGFGLGALVDQIDGHTYVEFVGTGTIATAVMMSSVFSAMFGAFFKAEHQHTYDALLAAPVDTEEIVTAEALWIGLRASVYGCIPMFVAMIFGLDPAWGMFAVPVIAFFTGFGWACFGLIFAAILNSVDHFSYVTSTIVTPLFLCAGTFFPISTLPSAIEFAANFNPVYHCVELVRGFIFNTQSFGDVAFHVSVIWAFSFICWRIAIRCQTKNLIH